MHKTLRWTLPRAILEHIWVICICRENYWVPFVIPIIIPLDLKWETLDILTNHTQGTSMSKFSSRQVHLYFMSSRESTRECLSVIKHIELLIAFTRMCLWITMVLHRSVFQDPYIWKQSPLILWKHVHGVHLLLLPQFEPKLCNTGILSSIILRKSTSKFSSPSFYASGPGSPCVLCPWQRGPWSAVIKNRDKSCTALGTSSTTCVLNTGFYFQFGYIYSKRSQ